jgi:N-carbamoyl-L-amino-acid hydrolase
MGLIGEAGLSVSIDAAGNICGRRAGSDSKLLPLVIGSHLDSVPQGGNYDGVVGSLGAIEVAQILSEGHLALRHPLEVLIFQNEEGGLQGSRAISGELREEDLNQTTRSGKTLREGIAFIGGDPAHLAAARRKPGDIFANLELHIEQGGTLATEKIDIDAGRAQSMSRLGPSGMVFIASIGGISHSPEEFSRPQDIVNGANVLLQSVLQLDSQNW